MPLLVSERDRRAAVELAGQNPIEGFDPGFVARFKADLADNVQFHNSDATGRNRMAVTQEFIDAFYKESGRALPNWTPMNDPIGLEVESYDRKREAARAQFDAWKVENPGSALIFPEDDAVRRAADERALAARKTAQRMSDRSTSWSSTGGGVAGGLVGAMRDPVNVISMAFGAGAAQGIVRTALVEGGIGAAAEAGIQVATFADKQRIDPTYSLQEAASQIALSAAGGAVIGGGIKGIAAAWQRASTGQWPRNIRDAAAIVSREASIPTSRLGKSASIDGLHRAAIDRAADDLAANRPVELPPDLFMASQARPGRVYDSDGRSVGVTYEVVEADSLVTSHDDNLVPNAAFPQELQPRDRSRAISKDQVAAIAANLQPERLGPSPQADSGAPIVGPDGLVESGNGRVLALRRAYADSGVPAANYRNFLQAHGFDAAGLRNPVLIARRVTDLDPESRLGFVSAANRATAMRLGAGEQALADARLIDDALMERLEGADVDAAGNRRFVQGFMQRLSRAEQGELVDRAGVLSQAGERRITAALMGRAYGEPVLLGRALEDADSNIKTLAGALADASVPWVRMRDAVATGAVPRGMDITDDLLEAMRVVMKARDEGRAVRDLVNQAEMFGGLTDIGKIVARAMFNEDFTRAVSRQRVAKFLSDYASEARKNDAGDRLFGEPLESTDILKSSLERAGREDLRDVVESRLTPDRIDQIAKADETMDAVIAQGEVLRSGLVASDGATRRSDAAAGGPSELLPERLRADDANLVGEPDAGKLRMRAGPAPIVDMGDGLGPRSLDDIYREADEEIGMAADLEACTIGKPVGDGDT